MPKTNFTIAPIRSEMRKIRPMGTAEKIPCLRTQGPKIPQGSPRGLGAIASPRQNGGSPGKIQKMNNRNKMEKLSSRTEMLKVKIFSLLFQYFNISDQKECYQLHF